MNNYIFKFPKDMPRFDYQSLTDYIGTGNYRREVGTTLLLQRYDDYVGVFLYGFPIAYVGPLSVLFLPGGDDGHMATTQWVAMIARHNGIAVNAGRIRRRKGDGPGIPVARGTAGLLVFDWERRLPVVRTGYRVNLGKRRQTMWWHEREDASA